MVAGHHSRQLVVHSPLQVLAEEHSLSCSAAEAAAGMSKHSRREPHGNKALTPHLSATAGVGLVVVSGGGCRTGWLLPVEVGEGAAGHKRDCLHCCPSNGPFCCLRWSKQRLQI